MKSLLTGLLYLVLSGAAHSAGDGVTLRISSSVFSDLGPIPSRYTCDGRGISPSLSWTGVPEGARSLALIESDPDAPDPAAPRVVWVHWVLYNLPPDSRGLPEGVQTLPPGTLEGANGWGRTGYGGPCPPVGRHRYFYTLYALNVVLPDLGRPTMADLERAMQGHVLARGVLVGTYLRH